MVDFKRQSRLKRNIFSGSFAAAGGIIISVIVYPIYLHFLGAELYGLWAILNVIIYFSSIGNFGIDEALVKYVAEEYEKKNLDGVIEHISTGLNVLIANGIVIFVILILFEKFLQPILKLDVSYAALFHDIFPFVVILSIFILIVNFINSILKGLGRFDQASYILLSGRVCAIMVSILFFIRGYKIWSLYWGQVVSSVLVLIVSSLLICNKIGFYYWPLRSKKRYFIKLFKFGGTMTASKILSMLLEPFIKVVIARFIGLAEVAYFEIANKIVLQIRSLFERGISAIMPEVSRLSVVIEDTKIRIFEVMKKINRFNLLIGMSVFLLLFFIGEPILKFWLAEEYSPVIVIAFRILTIGYFINLLSVPSYYYFMGTGKVKYCLYNHFIQAMLNLALVLILIFFNLIDFRLSMMVYSFAIASSAGVLIMLYYSNTRKQHRRAK